MEKYFEWIDNAAKGTLKKRSFFSMQNSFQPGYPEKTYPGPPVNAAPNSLNFQKRKHILDSRFLLWQNSNKHILHSYFSGRN